VAGSPLRLGIVGVDHWYAAFALAESLPGREDVVLAAVADADLDHASALARRAGVERVTTDPDEILQDPEIDAVASLVSVGKNPRICLAAARAGKHLISVKPFARTLAEGTEILRAVRDAGIVFLPLESQRRLSPQYGQIKQWVQEGRLGRILTANHSLSSSLPQRWRGETDSGWFLDPAQAPGGGWIDHSIYEIDTLRWLLEDEVADVSGVAANLKYPDLPLEDYGSAQVTFNNGVLATIEVTWLAPKQAGRSYWTIIGTEGAIAHDSLTGRFSIAGNFPPFNGWTQTALGGSASADLLGHFAACVRGEATPIATVEDAWRNLAVCRAFYEAAEQHASVAPAGLPGA
jgi:predicted dehydrogenase